MEPLGTLALVGHFLAVVLLVGTTVTMALVIIPAIRRGRLSAEAVRELGQRFAVVAAASGIGALLTGVYFSSLAYTPTALVSTPSGRVAIASILVWAILAVALTVGTNRLARETAVGNIERAAERSQSWYNAAAVVSVLGLIVFGAL